MTLKEFIEKYNNKGIDFDSAFKTQCVDLYRQYIKEVLMFPQSSPVANAKDIWNTYLPDYFKRVENTPHGIPEVGDIIIWNTKIGKSGHVAIFLEGDAKKFISFDQNFPVGTLCHKQSHTYKGVLGWLKPIFKEIDMPEWFKTLLQENNLTIENESNIRSIFDKAKKYDDKIKELQQQIISANETLADKSREVSLLIDKITNLENKIAELEEQLNQTRDSRDTAIFEKTKMAAENEKLEDIIKKLNSKIEFFKGNKPIFAYSWIERLLSLFGK